MKVRCPACREWTTWENNPSRPFCSEACKDRDLGSWASEEYKLPDSGESGPDTLKKKSDEDE